MSGLALCRHAEALPLCERGVAALDAALGPSNANVASALMLQVWLLDAPLLSRLWQACCVSSSGASCRGSVFSSNVTDFVPLAPTSLPARSWQI